MRTVPRLLALSVLLLAASSLHAQCVGSPPLCITGVSVTPSAVPNDTTGTMTVNFNSPQQYNSVSILLESNGNVNFICNSGVQVNTSPPACNVPAQNGGNSFTVTVIGGNNGCTAVNTVVGAGLQGGGNPTTVPFTVNGNPCSPFPPNPNDPTPNSCVASAAPNGGGGGNGGDASGGSGATQAACTVGAPINVISGNTWITQHDYSLPGALGGIDLTRTWNSGWQSYGPPNQSGMFGNGWTSTYEQRIQPFTVNGTSGQKTWLSTGDSNFFSYNSVSNSYAIYSPANATAGLSFNSGTQKFSYTFPDGTTETFTQPGYLTAIIDRNGNTTNITLDGQNRITQVTDPANRSITFSYTDANNPNQATSVSDSTGTIATYTYSTGDNNAHRLLSVTYSDGSAYNFQYNDSNSNTLISGVTDSAGKVVESHTYDSLRRGVTSSRAVVAGSSTAVDYVWVIYSTSGQQQVVKVYNSLSGVANVFNYINIKGKNYVSAITGPSCSTCGFGSNESFAYDQSGNLVAVTDANNFTTSYTYDANFNLASKKQLLTGNNPANIIWTYTYNSFGELLTATDPIGNTSGVNPAYHTTTYAYDSKGNLKSITGPSPDNGVTAGSVTKFQYLTADGSCPGNNTNGLIKGITDPLGNNTCFTYWPSGLIETVTDAQSNQTQFVYDNRGNRTTVTDALQQVSTFNYDAVNRLKKIIYPTSPATNTQFTYDNRGRRSTVTDQNGNVTSYFYDDADRLTGVSDANLANETPGCQDQYNGNAKRTTCYRYDTESNLTDIYDAKNNHTQFAYNSGLNSSWLTTTTFPSTLTENYGYDAVGNLTSKQDRKNNNTTYYYDSLNRLTEKLYQDSSSVTFAPYDADSRLTQAQDTNGTYNFTFDNMGRLTEADTLYNFVSGTPTYKVKYTYDPASNRLSMTDPQSGVTKYQYDTLNRLQFLFPVGGGPASNFGYNYDALSRRNQLTRPNGITTTYGYDPVSALTSILHKNGSTTLDGATYSHTYNGVTDNINWAQKTDNRTNDVWGYAYDSLYELTKVYKNSTLSYTYPYDSVGNINVPGWVYNNANQLTSESGINTRGYDNNGNTTTETQTGVLNWTMGYDFENRMTSWSDSVSNRSQAYKYDPFGRRAQKTYVYQGTTYTTNYIYDAANKLEEFDQNANLTARYTQGLGIDEPLALLKSGVTSYFETDALGTLTSLSNTSGALSDTFTYVTNSWGNIATHTGPTSLPERFTGREYDETGLYYYRARFYDSGSGRFLSEDPIGLLGGTLNFYAYAMNNPVMWTDNSGLKVWKCHRRTRFEGAAAAVNSIAPHFWLRTDTKEAGLGDVQGVPGRGGKPHDSPYITPTMIVNHAGESSEAGVTCEEIPDENEQCVDKELDIGKRMGPWTLTNNCWTFTNDVLSSCAIDKPKLIIVDPNGGLNAIPVR